MPFEAWGNANVIEEIDARKANALKISLTMEGRLKNVSQFLKCVIALSFT